LAPAPFTSGVRVPEGPLAGTGSPDRKGILWAGPAPVRGPFYVKRLRAEICQEARKNLTYDKYRGALRHPAYGMAEKNILKAI